MYRTLSDVGTKHLLLSGGEDCMLKAWDVGALAQACGSEDGPAVAPAWAFRAPRSSSPLGMVAKDATVIMISVEQPNATVYIGAL